MYSCGESESKGSNFSVLRLRNRRKCSENFRRFDRAECNIIEKNCGSKIKHRTGKGGGIDQIRRFQAVFFTSQYVKDYGKKKTSGNFKRKEKGSDLLPFSVSKCVSFYKKLVNTMNRRQSINGMIICVTAISQ